MYSLYVALPICTAKAQGRAVSTHHSWSAPYKGQSTYHQVRSRPKTERALAARICWLAASPQALHSAAALM